MSLRVAVRHCTGYRYGRPVRASFNEARMTPLTGSGQQTLEARLEVAPAVRPLRYRDYWGTVVDAFDVHTPHTELVVTATSVVETATPRAVPPDGVGWDAVVTPAVRDRFAELLGWSRYVVAEPEVAAVASGLAAAYPPVEAGRRAATWAHEQLGYGRGATTVHTSSAEARAVGTGVCQDYTHVTLAVMRAMGLPSRYVSGYLLPTPDAEIGQTDSGEGHAWVEFWAGEWVPVDPTSLVDVGERHVLVARGRDYADVRPLSGVYSGPPAESLGVVVELTRLR
jgi:transglutaminase-like putative cysteine protease